MAELLRETLSGAFPGLPAVAEHAGRVQPSGSILLSSREADPELGDEGYELRVASNRVVLRAPAAAGLFHATQTLRQLLPARIESGAPSPEVSLANVAITDRPRFGWRGLMLDTSRTFLPIELLRRYVDLLALYKMSVLHLHLSDDQGFRIESESHPELHEIGSLWDAERAPGERSGYYTKQELRDLVAYAARRHVEIIPEIDMPGHSLAILRARPELACTTSPEHVRRRDEFRLTPWFEGPQIHTEVMCACDERIYSYIEEILAEVSEIFPSPYFHLGGDETPRTEWETSYLCQQRIAAGEIESTEAVQAYFSRRMEEILQRLGKRMIGWTEVVTHEQASGPESRLSDDFTTMHWLALVPDPPALYDRDVVQSPIFTLYLDWFATTSLEGVYRYEPVPDGLTPEQEAHILGAQGNMWTGFPQQRTEERIDIHVFPKLLAVAELTWSPRELRDWPDFDRRRQQQTERLDLLGVARGPCDDCVV